MLICLFNTVLISVYCSALFCHYTLSSDLLLFSATCSPDQFTCANGQCISSAQRCDRRNDCNDGSDERNCRKFMENRFITILGHKQLEKIPLYRNEIVWSRKWMKSLNWSVKWWISIGDVENWLAGKKKETNF